MNHQVQETTFASRTYLLVRQEIEIRNTTNQAMWQEAFGKVHRYAQENGVQISGPGTALYFRWDEPTGQTELGIGNPVQGVAEVNDGGLSLVSVAESKAAHLTLRGSYDQLPKGHRQLHAYLHQHSLTPTLTVEEYTVMGMDQPDPKDRETNIYYLHG